MFSTASASRSRVGVRAMTIAGTVAPWLRASVDEPALEAETAQIGYWEQAPYRFTDIHAGAWGVGLKSVRDYFDAQLSDPTTWSYSLERARRRA